MPGGDGTGPGGLGPMTGRMAGYCAGYSVPGSMNLIPGRGFGGRGRGGGWGRRNRFYATRLAGSQPLGMGWPGFHNPGPYVTQGAMPFTPAITPEQELNALKGQEEYLTDDLEGIKRRIEELESQAAGKSR